MTASTASFRILNAQGLIADFRQHRIDKQLHIKYLLGDIVLLTLGGVSMSMRMPSGDGSLGWPLTLALMAAIVGIGTLWCYRKNQQGDDVDFLDRFIAVNFVVSMRFFVAYAFIMATVFILSPLLGGTAFLSTLGDSAVSYLVIMVAVFCLYYYFVATYIGQIAETALEKSADATGA